MAAPRRWILPELGATTPDNTLIILVLPPPFGPINAVTQPSSGTIAMMAITTTP